MIVSTAGICGGQPRIEGRRVRVVDVIRYIRTALLEGKDIPMMIRDYGLTLEDAAECLEFVSRGMGPKDFSTE